MKCEIERVFWWKCFPMKKVLITISNQPSMLFLKSAGLGPNMDFVMHYRPR